MTERSGISLTSLKRFESTGKIYLERLLLLAWSFGRLDEFTSLLEEPEIMTLADIRKLEKETSTRKTQIIQYVYSLMAKPAGIEMP